MQMELILLKNVKNLGKIGEITRVAMGYARYLLRQKIALRATDANKADFNVQREHWETLNTQHKEEAQSLALLLNDKAFVLVRQAGETGHLYGSVSGRDVADVLIGEGFQVERTMVVLPQPIKTIGIHEVAMELHTDVKSKIYVIISKSLEEGETQRKSLESESQKAPVPALPEA